MIQFVSNLYYKFCFITLGGKRQYLGVHMNMFVSLNKWREETNIIYRALQISPSSW